MNITIDNCDRSVIIDYTNWEGERRERLIKPRYIYFGVTKYHTEPQWLLKAFDVDKQDWRRFPLKNIHSWRPNELEEVDYGQEETTEEILPTF